MLICHWVSLLEADHHYHSSALLVSRWMTYKIFNFYCLGTSERGDCAFLENVDQKLCYVLTFSVQPPSGPYQLPVGSFGLKIPQSLCSHLCSCKSSFGHFAFGSVWAVACKLYVPVYTVKMSELCHHAHPHSLPQYLCAIFKTLCCFASGWS